MSNGCAGAAGGTLIFACSGAADVGAIADRAARAMAEQGAGTMFCLAGIGGHVQGIVETTGRAKGVLAIDGCPVDCVRLTLEHAGFTRFTHVRVTDMGFEKGKSPVTEEAVGRVAENGTEALRTREA